MPFNWDCCIVMKSRMHMLLVVLGLACCRSPNAGEDVICVRDSGSNAAGGAPVVHPSLIAGPTLRPPPTGTYLAQWFSVATDVPTSLTLHLVDEKTAIEREIEFSEFEYEHEVPVLQLRGQAMYHVYATLCDSHGSSIRTPSLGFSVDAPDELPEIEVVAADPSRMEPGITLFPLTVLGEQGWLAAVDEDGEYVFAQRAPPGTLALTRLPDGNLALNEGTSVAIRQVMGRTIHRWTPTPSSAEDLPVPFPRLHHEMLPQPDGSVFTLAYRDREVPDYPESYDDLTSGVSTVIQEDIVVHLGADGSVLATFYLGDMLDTTRIGFDSLEPGSSGRADWSHANAVQYDSTADTVTVSLRHQDAIVNFEYSTGDIRWIISPEGGWRPDLASRRLRQDEPFVWPVHSHGVEVDGDIVRVFDNGNNSRNTPYYTSGQNGADYSRLLELRIDEARGTVSFEREFVYTTTGAYFSPVLGNADHLNTTGNRLATWGAIPRVVEFTEDGEVVYEFVARPWGWKSDRATRIPSLYGDDVVIRHKMANE
ncbi:MAG: aryl-sulfate sulfotransferase [Myxococcota bacterium]